MPSTQTAWNNYAANIDGDWQLCANCAPSSIGKKLFRQYNFYRALLGLPAVNEPLDDTEFAVQNGAAMGYSPAPVIGPPFVNFEPAVIGTSTIIVAQVGLGLQNPILDMTGLIYTVYFAGSAPYNFAAAVWNALPGNPANVNEFTCCCFNASGAPGLKELCTISTS